jgi:NAD(P)-dependent dehydrogenase (short-subunit alcohol dehydrogenase family)
MTDLSGLRHAFVTGGASGIGLAMVQALLARGLHVTIADIDAAALTAACTQNHPKRQKLSGVALDVRDRAGWREARQEAEARSGPVDILINNAGIGPNTRLLADMKPASFDAVLDINLTGAFNGVSAFASDLRSRGVGHILNVSSLSGGLAVGRPTCGGFAAANFGIVGFSEVLREELAPHGVGVSVLCPGLVSTNLGYTTARVAGEDLDLSKPMPASTVDASMVAACALRGIENDDPYIASHPHQAPIVEKRFERMQLAFEIPPPDTAARMLDSRRHRHAFVTGGASGIGLGIVDALLAQGLSVTIADIDREALARLGQRGLRVTTTHLEVRDRDGWQAAKQHAERHFGPVDILVNNAGIGPDGRHAADADPVSFDRLLAINLTGIFNGIATFGAQMRERRTGHIVNTASLMALAPAYAGTTAYTTSKCGIVALSEVLRSEMAPHGVGVSVLCPAYVKTNFHANTKKAGSEVMPTTVPDRVGLPLPIVGAYVIRGIAQNHPYIVTHPETLPSFMQRTARLLAAVTASGAG